MIVWEKDIVRILGMKAVGTVVFDKEFCRYSIKIGAGRYVSDFGRFTNELEVIGNIFDNSELLKEGGE